MRTHKPSCECDECYAEDILEQYPYMVCLQQYSAKEVAEIWSNYSQESSANWLDDDAKSVFQVFYQAHRWIAAGKPENFSWKIGRFFK